MGFYATVRAVGDTAAGLLVPAGAVAIDHAAEDYGPADRDDADVTAEESFELLAAIDVGQVGIEVSAHGLSTDLRRDTRIHKAMVEIADLYDRGEDELHGLRLFGSVVRLYYCRHCAT